MFFAVYQANSSRSACTRKGHGSNLVHARAFHTGYSQAHWGFSDCCFEVDKDIRQNTLWKTCARWCHHCWTRRNVALSRVKKNKLWIWKAYRRETGELIDWECGGRDKGTLSKLMERLSRWKVELFCTDNWGVYPEVIVADKLYQSKSQTVYLEQNNGRQRHWFARFRRKSIVVSKTLEMVDLTMALFARFHVNGSWKDIASLFSWHPPLRKSVVKDCACASSLEASFQRVTNAIALPCMDSQVKDMDFSSKLLTYSYNDLFCKTQHSLNAGCGNSWFCRSICSASAINFCTCSGVGWMLAISISPAVPKAYQTTLRP